MRLKAGLLVLTCLLGVVLAACGGAGSTGEPGPTTSAS